MIHRPAVSFAGAYRLQLWRWRVLPRLHGPTTQLGCWHRSRAWALHHVLGTPLAADDIASDQRSGCA